MVESFAGHMTVSNFIGHNIAIYVFLLHVMSPNNYKYYYCFMFLSNFLSHRHRRRHHYVIIARSNSTRLDPYQLVEFHGQLLDLT